MSWRHSSYRDETGVRRIDHRRPPRNAFRFDLCQNLKQTNSENRHAPANINKKRSKKKKFLEPGAAVFFFFLFFFFMVIWLLHYITLLPDISYIYLSLFIWSTCWNFLKCVLFWWLSYFYSVWLYQHNVAVPKKPHQHLVWSLTIFFVNMKFPKHQN